MSFGSRIAATGSFQGLSWSGKSKYSRLNVGMSAAGLEARKAAYCFSFESSGFKSVRNL